MIPQAKINEVLAALDILSIYQEYLPLKQQGKLYRALCPFHNEKTPSFTIHPNMRWYCYGACKEGGDIINFLMKKTGKTFPQVMDDLARRAGVTLTQKTAQEQYNDKLKALLRKAAELFNKLLLKGKGGIADRARAYLKKRGFTLETIKTFQIGVSPLDDRMMGVLFTLGYDVKILLDSGLVRQNKDGTISDFFRGRLMFPIRNEYGQTVGFGARTLGTSKVKYINSPQNKIFNKSQVLFGLDLARQAIREAKQAVIVEGYTDAMMAHQQGYRNVVAQMGTALTIPQLKSLQHYSSNAVIVYDGDEAGHKSAMKAATIQSPINLQVATLPADTDPFDFLRRTPDLWSDVLKEASSVIEYYIDALLREMPDTAEGKQKLVTNIAPALQVLSPISKDHYIRRLAQQIGVRASSINAVVGTVKSNENERIKQDKIPADLPKVAPEDYVLALSIAGGFELDVGLTHPENQALYQAFKNGNDLFAYADRLEYLFDIYDKYIAPIVAIDDNLEDIEDEFTRAIKIIRTKQEEIARINSAYVI